MGETWYPVMRLTAGVAHNDGAGKSKNFPPHDGVFSSYNYSANQRNAFSGLLGAFVGLEWLKRSPYTVQSGLGYYRPTLFTAKGTVLQGLPSPTEVYSYQYHIQASQLLLENKLRYDGERKYHPYVVFGIGIGFNSAEDFEVDIQPPFTTFSNQFADKTTQSFSYDFGFGVDYDFSPSTRVGLGYQFTDYGRVGTGSAIIDTVVTNNALEQVHFYVNELVCQMTYIFK